MLDKPRNPSLVLVSVDAAVLLIWGRTSSNLIVASINGQYSRHTTRLVRTHYKRLQAVADMFCSMTTQHTTRNKQGLLVASRAIPDRVPRVN
jgi:hypothetical protein